MALATYADLQSNLTAFMIRKDLSARAADWITLGEAELNRQIPAVETDAMLSTTVGSRSVSTASLAMVTPIAVFIKESGREREVTPVADGNFPYSDSAGRPTKWGLDGYNIDFDCPADGVYPVRLRFQQRFALSDVAPTNWLLTNHPDVYLAACVFWGWSFTGNFEDGGNWKQVSSQGIREVKTQLRRSRKSLLTIDPALHPRRSYGSVLT